ncbi:unnamed protein product [Peniophora sp. CBMAI 1063]|nr:unnamed protein product [Peniophora sp. CBMAI 1063]
MAITSRVGAAGSSSRSQRLANSECHTPTAPAARRWKMTQATPRNSWCLETLKVAAKIIRGRTRMSASRPCANGRGSSLDGFVRMEIGFEVMYCDMTNGLKLVSAVEAMPYVPISGNIDPPNRGMGSPRWRERPGRPSGWRDSLPTKTGNNIRVAAKRHAQAPGETRVHTLYDKIVTLCDLAVISLLNSRHGKPCEEHRLKGVSKADAGAKLRELDGLLSD